jgi:protein O-mannosyl-transferase
MHAEIAKSYGPRQRILLIALGLVLITVLAYMRVPSLRFLRTYDDALYITKNPVVQGGLTWDGVAWAFTTGHAANWHPLTWLSHMLDVTLFGLDPASHHLMNLLIHLINVLLLFAVLRAMTGRLGASAAVAALWAVHPLHVESVAWVSERKDVLSALFWLLALWAYGRYVSASARRRAYYLLTVLFTAFGLMAKPMVVTLPFVLLLLDYWPLKRLSGRRELGPLVIEKIPLFALAGVSAVITLVAQQRYGAVQAVGDLPLAPRLANAATAYVQYLGKTFWPAELAAIYPHPGAALSLAFGASAALFLVLITLIALVYAGRAPYLIVGWLWFLGVLVPVIGLVQVGSQAIADRYTYLPHIGLFVALVWLAADLLRPRRNIAAGLAVAVVLVLSVLTFRQTYYWRDSITLFRHTIAVTGPNPLARINLGGAYLDTGLANDALAEFDEAARLDSTLALAQYNRGVALQRLNRIEDARAAFEQAVLLNPEDAAAYNNLGFIMAHQGDEGGAIDAFIAAIDADPELAEAYVNLGSSFARQDNLAAAEDTYRTLLARYPNHVQALINLANIYARTHRPDDARSTFGAALDLDPTNALAHYNLAVLLNELGDEVNAQRHLDEATRLRGEGH